MTEIRGSCPDQFGSVRAALAASLAADDAGTYEGISA
jgi:hypothetical protein